MKRSPCQGPKIGHPRAAIMQTNWNLHLWIRGRVAVSKSSNLNTVRQATVAEGYSLRLVGPRIWQLAACRLSSNSRRPLRTLYRFKTWYKCLNNKMDIFSPLCRQKASNNRWLNQTSPAALRQRPTSKSRAWARSWRTSRQQQPQPRSSGSSVTTRTAAPPSTPPSWALSALNSSSQVTAATMRRSPLRACWRRGAGTARWIMRRVTGGSSSLARWGTMGTMRARHIQGIGTRNLCRSRAPITIQADSLRMYYSEAIIKITKMR